MKFTPERLEELKTFPLSYQLRKLRTWGGFTQEEAARLLKIGQGTISSYEKGERVPNPIRLEKYVDFFDLPLDYFDSQFEDIEFSEERWRKQKTIVINKNYKQERAFARKIIKQMEKKMSEKPMNIPHKVIVIDTETTGLNAREDEILQLSVIDGDGNTVLNKFYKPKYRTSWEKAQEVNGISPEQVADCPNITDDIPLICDIIHSADIIIGYNTSFDLLFLEILNIVPKDDCVIIDVMKEFAPIYGEISSHYGGYKWQKLTKCAEYFNYDWGEEKAHDSLADCRATLFCYHKIREIIKQNHESDNDFPF